MTFFEKLFPGKTLWHKECSDKAVICFLLKVRFCFARSPKNFSSDPEKNFFLNISNVFISENFLRAHRMELAQARLNVFPWSWKICCSNQKKSQNLLKKFSIETFLWAHKICFCKAANNYSLKRRQNFDRSPRIVRSKSKKIWTFQFLRCFFSNKFHGHSEFSLEQPS